MIWAHFCLGLPTSNMCRVTSFEALVFRQDFRERLRSAQQSEEEKKAQGLSTFAAAIASEEYARDDRHEIPANDRSLFRQVQSGVYLVGHRLWKAKLQKYPTCLFFGEEKDDTTEHAF